MKERYKCVIKSSTHKKLKVKEATMQHIIGSSLADEGQLEMSEQHSHTNLPTVITSEPPICIDKLDFYNTQSLSANVEQVGLTLDKRNQTYLQNCFDILLNGKELKVEPEVTKDILKSTFHLQFDLMNKTLQDVLLEYTIYLIIMWPEWQNCSQYFSGEVGFEEFYGRFERFIRDGVEDLVKNEERCRNETEICKPSPSKDQAVHVKPDTTDFAIQVSAPPVILSNIVFSAALNGDVHIKQYPSKPLFDLELKHLVNWPHVTINFMLPYLEFSRRNWHEVTRYLSDSVRSVLNKRQKRERIFDVRRLSSESNCKVYSADFIKNRMSGVLSNVRSAQQSNNEACKVMSVVFDQLIADIKESNIHNCSAATETCVSFNIGQSSYVRVKKKNKDHAKITFIEIITPKVEYTLKTFNPGLLKALKEKSKPLREWISFSCDFCNFVVLGHDKWKVLVEHYQDIHKEELPVLCSECSQQFDIGYLAENRWAHPCPKLIVEVD